MKTINDEAINKSVWDEENKPSLFKPLDKNIKTDILIVGGGISGILCAYRLKKMNFNVCICEKKRIGSGITKNTTAFVTAQHDMLYHDMIKKNGFKKAKVYLESNLEAVKEYQELAKQIDFDYETVDSCNFSKNSIFTLNDEYKALKNLGYEPKYVSTIPFPFEVMGGISFENQGQMNPLKLINELSKDLKIYEDSEVIDIISEIAIVKNMKTKIDYNVKFNKIIICTNFPTLPNFCSNLGFSLKMYQKRSFVLAIKRNMNWNINGTYTDISKKGLYYREYKDKLIIGGIDTRTGYCLKNSFKELANEVMEQFPNCEITNYWANQDCVTLDGFPYIGKVKNNVYVVTGFNLWGMTQAMVASFIISDLIMGKENKYAWAFDVKRCILRKNLFINLKTTIGHLFNFQKKRRCTHLGCTLELNRCERSYDCPCHGSRFSESGEVINGPAKDDLE